MFQSKVVPDVMFGVAAVSDCETCSRSRRISAAFGAFAEAVNGGQV